MAICPTEISNLPPTTSGVPWYEQPKLGSSRTLRGLFADRYRDEGRLLLNTELRWLGVPLLPEHRIYGGANLFADVGQVYPGTDASDRPALLYGVGVGLRVYWYSSIARVDVGFADGSTGVYKRFAQVF